MPYAAERVPSLEKLDIEKPQNEGEFAVQSRSFQTEASRSFLSRHPDSDASLLMSAERADALQHFPSSCTNGTLRLTGKYEVTEVVAVQGDCDIVGDGAELQLHERLIFNGSVHFSGVIRISAQRALLGACLKVTGNCTVTKSAEVAFGGCSNEAVVGGKRIGNKGDFNSRRGSSRGLQYVERGGGLNVLGALQILGNLSFHNCHSLESGGGAANVRGPVLQQGGNLVVTDCSSGKLGGGIYAQEGFDQSGGDVRISRVRAGNNGGAILAMGRFSQSGGTMLIQESTITKGEGGGAIATAPAPHKQTTFVQSGGTLRIEHSSAPKSDKRGGGGGAIFTNFFYKSGGHLAFNNCSAVSNAKSDRLGGAILAKGGFSMSGGFFRAEDCSAKKYGGALHIYGNMSVSGGELVFERCSLKHLVKKAKRKNVYQEEKKLWGRSHGGAINAVNFIQSGGAVRIADCATDEGKGYGGGLSARQSLTLTGGILDVRQSSSSYYGGGVYTRNFTQLGGMLNVQHCFAVQGGGIYVNDGPANQFAGNISVHGCHAKGQGGGILIHNSSFSSHGYLDVQQCMALGDKGGGLLVESNVNLSGSASFVDCSVDNGHGGGIYSSGNITITGPATFKNCEAKYKGGGCISLGSVEMQNATFDHCKAEGAGLWAKQSIKIASTTYIGEPQPPRGANSFIKCDQKGAMSFDVVYCPRGSGLRVGDRAMGCYMCNPGRTRLSSSGNDFCVECPEEATHNCTPTELALLPGFMAQLEDPRNLSRIFRCPNEKACPGGIVSAAESFGQPPETVQAMCASGFEGLGCLQCNASSHARSDNSVLQCIRCEDSFSQVATHVMFYVGKDTLLFTSAALSVLNVGSKKTSSGVLINQLMAFAAVSGSIMSGVMQTQSFRTLKQSTREWLNGLGLAVDTLQGTSGSAGMSLECIAGDLGLGKSLLHAHFLSCITPFILIVFLAIKRDPWLAMVVGTNVFLPGFVAFFGKYLVMLRLRPEGEVGGEMRYEFLPPILQSPNEVITLIIVIVSACFSLAIYGWVHAVLRRKEPPPVHVAYLMLPYKPEFAFWEVERLVRKMLLVLVSSMLPTAISPALQMEGIALVLLCSLGLCASFRPYKADAWNLAEISLLLVALAIAGLTTCLLANDLHWAHSESTQVVLIYLICSLAAGISIGMAVLIAFALLRERRERKQQDGA